MLLVFMKAGKPYAVQTQPVSCLWHDTKGITALYIVRMYYFGQPEPPIRSGRVCVSFSRKAA
jgi:hypothetical protein